MTTKDARETGVEHEPLLEPDVDENGVDLAQVREALARSPMERLRQLDRFMRQVFAIRQLNGWD